MTGTGTSTAVVPWTIAWACDRAQSWSAADLYLDCMRKYGGSHPPALSPQDKLRATLVIRFFTAMATDAYFAKMACMASRRDSVSTTRTPSSDSMDDASSCWLWGSA